MQGHGGDLLLEQVVLGVADHGVGDGQLVVGAGVHEDEAGAVVVQVLHLAAVDVGGVDLGVGVERPVHDLAGQHVLELGPHHGVALARLVVLEPDHRPELTVEVQHHAVLQIVRRRHAASLSGSRPPAGQRPSLEEVVSLAGRAARRPQVHRRPWPTVPSRVISGASELLTKNDVGRVVGTEIVPQLPLGVEEATVQVLGNQIAAVRDLLARSRQASDSSTCPAVSNRRTVRSASVGMWAGAIQERSAFMMARHSSPALPTSINAGRPRRWHRG